MDSITLESPLDMHVHFRTGDMLKSVVPHTVETYAGALVRPTTVPPITTREMVESYRNEREKANLLHWQLTCECFYTPQEWEWLFETFGYTGDHSFIYFE